MNLTRCARGHFYDADKDSACPHCAAGNGDEMTVPIQKTPEEDGPTRPINAAPTAAVPTAAPKSDLSSEIKGLQNVSAASVTDDAKTISYSQAKIGLEPVVGWLVAIDGEHMGEDFRLTSGRNFIGRSTSMNVALTKDKSVSRDKHAIVLYEPKSHIFIVQPGESRELCYLNGNVVLAAQEMKRNDVLMVGDSKLMLFPCCDATFNWDTVEKKED